MISACINTDPVTLTGWFNFSNVTGPAFVFGNDDGGWDRGVEVGGGIWYVRNNTGNISTGISALANQWYQVTLIYANSSMYLYINGTLKWTGTQSGTSGNYNMTIGAAQYATYSRYLSGSIDDVRVYNRALSAAEIAALYNAEK